MNNWKKLGYLLVGAGLGVFATTLAFEQELNKPIGEIEEYVPKYSENDISNANNSKQSNGVEVSTAFSKSDTHILDYYKSDQEDTMGVKTLEKRAGNRNQSTRYSKYYEEADEIDSEKLPFDDVEEKLKAQSEANAEWNRRREEKEKAEANYGEKEYLAYIAGKTDEEGYPVDDEPEEEYDISDEDEGLVKERVENNFEIYLGENPQDFVSLVFYEGDNTLADDHEHVVPAADEVVGLVALSRLIEGGPGAENGVIFVRNLKTMINYEIVLDAGSYSETVLGIFDSRRSKGAGGDVDS